MSKRIVGISAYLYDPAGARTLWIEPGAQEKLNQGSRRVTRTRTLDGGAVTYDAGFAQADRTFTISARERYIGPHAGVGSFFASVVATYNLIKISTTEGLFSAVPSRWTVENGIATLEALVMEQIA